jgi:hypothetical protein
MWNSPESAALASICTAADDTVFSAEAAASILLSLRTELGCGWKVTPASEDAKD